MTMYKLFSLVTIVLVTNSNAARILAYFPVPSISHQVVFRIVTEELARRGHEVTVITTDPAFPKGKAPANLTEIDVHDLSYDMWTKAMIATDVTQGNSKDWIHQADIAFNEIVRIFEAQMKDAEVVKAVIDKKYDLLIIEACVYPALGLTHIHKIPVIQISSFGALEFNLATVGAPLQIFRQPTSTQQRVNNIALWEKIYELYMYYSMTMVVNGVKHNTDETLKRIFGPDTPGIDELRKNVDMIFLNVHSLWELNRPMPPNVVYTGGLHKNVKKELPADLKSYLDSSKNGVIYVSFGTNVDPSFLPADKIQALVGVFSKLPYDVLWKWNADELPGRTPNIRISKWLPQSDLLRHPKLKLFITQAGLQSTDEAISAGVPLIGVPMLGDQWYNAELYVYYKIGLRLDFSAITEEKLLSAINTVVSDKSYRLNVAKIRSIMEYEKENSLERVMWWTDYVLKFGGAKHLRSPMADMTWAEYLELELVLLLGAIATSVLFSFVFLARFLYRLVAGRPGGSRNTKLKKK